MSRDEYRVEFTIRAVAIDDTGNLERLVKKYGEDKVKKVLGELFEREILEEWGDVDSGGIILSDYYDFGEIEHSLKERRK